MAGQNTFENLLLNDDNMLEEKGNENENAKYRISLNNVRGH